MNVQPKKSNITLLYENQQYGILLIDSLLSFIVLSVTLSASTAPFTHVSILNIDNRDGQKEKDFCTEYISVDVRNIKRFHCSNQLQHTSQELLLWGLHFEDFNVSGCQTVIINNAL